MAISSEIADGLTELEADFPATFVWNSTSYNNIAFVYKAKKDLHKAKESWEKAHAVLLKKLGPNHPNTKFVKGQLDSLKE